MTKPVIGFIGLGLMGGNMVEYADIPPPEAGISTVPVSRPSSGVRIALARTGFAASA